MELRRGFEGSSKEYWGFLLAPTRIPGKTADLKTRLPYWQTQKADGLDYHRLGGGDCFERGA